MDKYTLNRNDTLLFIIDIQEKLAPVVDKKEMVIKNNIILIKAARILGLPIIVTEQYPKGLGATIPEIKAELSDSPIYEKINFSAHTEEVAGALKEHGRPKVLLTGMETHVCVFQTARDLLAQGFQVFLVEDAVSSRTKENYKSGKNLAASMGAVITNTETVIFDLLKAAGSPEFKELSRLIK